MERETRLELATPTLARSWYGINQGGLGLVSSNYTLNYQGNNLTITKALLNVIADAKTKVYGDADPSLTYQVSGLKNGDTAGAVPAVKPGVTADSARGAIRPTRRAVPPGGAAQPSTCPVGRITARGYPP